MKVSPSKLKTYQTCPKRYHYYYIQGLVRPEKRRTFDKGNYFHELCHVYYRLIRDIGAKPGSDMVVAQMTKRMQQDVKAHFSTGNAGIFKEVTTKFRRFMTEQSPVIDKDIVVEGVEEEINVPITLPSGKVVSMFGYIDLRYRDSSNGRIRDHKTGEKVWGGVQVSTSSQLLFYDVAILLLTGEAYLVEISFVNTKEYVKKVPSFDEVFAYEPAYHSPRELEIYLEQTCKLIDEMLVCEPTPHYDDRTCPSCPYLLPCTMERKGLDPTPILQAHYVPRNDNPRARTFTGEDSDANETDPIVLG